MDTEEVRDKMEAVSFSVNRVPRRTFLSFKELAEEEFCGDYGMTLKHLMEQRDIQEKIDDLQNQINRLKDKLEESDEIKTFGD